MVSQQKKRDFTGIASHQHRRQFFFYTKSTRNQNTSYVKHKKMNIFYFIKKCLNDHEIYDHIKTDPKDTTEISQQR